MLILSAPGPKQRIEELEFAPDGDTILAAGNGSWLDLWRLSTRERINRHLETADSKAWIVSAGFIFNGRAVIATCGTDGLRIRPVSPDAKGIAATHRVSGALRGMAVSADERHVIASTGSIFTGYTGMRGFLMWRADDGVRFRKRLVLPLSRNPGAPTFLPGGTHFLHHDYSNDFNPDGAALVKRSLSNGDICETAPCPYDSGGGPLLHPDGERFTVGSSKGVAVWSLRDLKKPPLLIRNDNRKHFTSSTFHPSGRWLAVSSNDGIVKLYDTATWQVVTTYNWSIGRLRSIAFSPDGTLAAVGSDSGKILVWDVDI
jgi:WD40 repeat protein